MKRDRAAYMRKYRRRQRNLHQDILELHNALVYHRMLIGRLQGCLATIRSRLGALENAPTPANAPSSSSRYPTTTAKSNCPAADA